MVFSIRMGQFFKNRKERLFFALILIVQIELIFLISTNYLGKIEANKERVKGISRINKEEIVFKETENLKYFYELNPNSIQEDLYTPSWLDYKPKITINKDSLNERFDYEIEKPVNVFRIVVLGDSWTYGRYVNTKDNFSEVLEDILNNNTDCRSPKKFEVINLGVPSYDIAYSAERFGLKGAKYKPDLVVWFLIENDFSEINEFLRERSNKYLQELSQTQGAKEGSYKDNILDSLTKPPYSPQVQSWLKALDDQGMEISDEERFKYQETALKSIDRYHKGNLLFLSLPKTTYIGQEETNIIKEIQIERKNTYLFEDFVDLKANSFLLPDQHPNKDGHRQIAKDLFNYLTSNRLISCN